MKKSEDFAEYFCRLMEEKEPIGTQKEMTEKLGISQGTLSKIKNGQLIPSDKMAKTIAEIWDVPDFMEHVYKARMEYSTRLFRKNNTVNEIENEEIDCKPRLPINAAAGVLSDYLGGILSHECECLPIIRSVPDYDFTMIVKGNSMEPKFEGGDEIACKKVDSMIEWGKPYVLATRDGAVLKRLYEDDNGVRCVSYNKDEYPDFKVSNDDILGVYKVVGLIRI